MEHLHSILFLEIVARKHSKEFDGTFPKKNSTSSAGLLNFMKEQWDKKREENEKAIGEYNYIKNTEP